MFVTSIVNVSLDAPLCAKFIGSRIASHFALFPSPAKSKNINEVVLPFQSEFQKIEKKEKKDIERKDIRKKDKNLPFWQSFIGLAKGTTSICVDEPEGRFHRLDFGIFAKIRRNNNGPIVI